MGLQNANRQSKNPVSPPAYKSNGGSGRRVRPPELKALLAVLVPEKGFPPKGIAPAGRMELLEQVVKGIHEELNGSREGLAVIQEWAPKHNLAERWAADFYAGLEADKQGNVTIGTLFHLAEVYCGLDIQLWARQHSALPAGVAETLRRASMGTLSDHHLSVPDVVRLSGAYRAVSSDAKVLFLELLAIHRRGGFRHNAKLPFSRPQMASSLGRKEINAAKARKLKDELIAVGLVEQTVTGGTVMVEGKRKDLANEYRLTCFGTGYVEGAGYAAPPTREFMMPEVLVAAEKLIENRRAPKRKAALISHKVQKDKHDAKPSRWTAKKERWPRATGSASAPPDVVSDGSAFAPPRKNPVVGASAPISEYGAERMHTSSKKKMCGLTNKNERQRVDSNLDGKSTTGRTTSEPSSALPAASPNGSEGKRARRWEDAAPATPGAGTAVPPAKAASPRAVTLEYIHHDADDLHQQADFDSNMLHVSDRHPAHPLPIPPANGGRQVVSARNRLNGRVGAGQLLADRRAEVVQFETANLAHRLSKTGHATKAMRDHWLEYCRTANEITQIPAWPELVASGLSDGQLFAAPPKGTSMDDQPMSVLAALRTTKGRLASAGDQTCVMISVPGQDDPYVVPIISEGEPFWITIGRWLDEREAKAAAAGTTATA